MEVGDQASLHRGSVSFTLQKGIFLVEEPTSPKIRRLYYEDLCIRVAVIPNVNIQGQEGRFMSIECLLENPALLGEGGLVDCCIMVKLIDPKASETLKRAKKKQFKFSSESPQTYFKKFATMTEVGSVLSGYFDVEVSFNILTLMKAPQSCPKKRAVVANTRTPASLMENEVVNENRTPRAPEKRRRASATEISPALKKTKVDEIVSPKASNMDRRTYPGLVKASTALQHERQASVENVEDYERMDDILASVDIEALQQDHRRKNLATTLTTSGQPPRRTELPTAPQITRLYPDVISIDDAPQLAPPARQAVPQRVREVQQGGPQHLVDAVRDVLPTVSVQQAEAALRATNQSVEGAVDRLLTSIDPIVEVSSQGDDPQTNHMPQRAAGQPAMDLMANEDAYGDPYDDVVVIGESFRSGGPSTAQPPGTIFIPDQTPIQPAGSDPTAELLAVFPDMAHAYASTLLAEKNGDVAAAVNSALEGYEKQKVAVPVQKEPEKSTSAQKVGHEYHVEAKHLLRSEFVKLRESVIVDVYTHFQSYLPAVKFLREYEKSNWTVCPDQKLAKIVVSFLKGSRKKTAGAIKDPTLRREYNECRAEKDHDIAAQLNQKDYEENCAMVECGCCFGEYVFEEMVQCTEGHLFCKACLENQAKEAAFGQGKPEMKCFDMDGCGGRFLNSTLQASLPSNIFEKLEERQTQADLDAAEIDNLEECPFCNYKMVVENDFDKVFRCQNPACMKESCRLCHEESHIPLRCNEVERKNETDLRTKVEEAMTAALVRKCPHKGCGKQMVKETGCNKMTCICGKASCYICRQPIPPKIGYNHFCQHAHVPGRGCEERCGKCSLWDNPEDEDKKKMMKAKESLTNEYLQAGDTRDEVLRNLPKV